MIVVPVKEGENIERALKKFKRKFEKTGVVKELRRRQCFKENEDKSVFTNSKSGATEPTFINSPITFTGCPLNFVVAIVLSNYMYT